MQHLEIDKAAVLDHMRQFNEADSERASDAGESRQQIGAFLEETGINSKAFSHCRMVLRMKKDDKRQDWLRSMRALLPLMEEQIAKDGTQDAFDGMVPDAAKAAAEEAPKPARKRATKAAPVDGSLDSPGDPEIAEEAAAFEAAMASGNVHQLQPGSAA